MFSSLLCSYAGVPPDAVTGVKTNERRVCIAATVNGETTYGKLQMISRADGTARRGRGHGMLQAKLVHARQWSAGPQEQTVTMLAYIATCTGT